MANEPDPPEAPKEWRVYEGDPTPDPEPEARTTPPPDPPIVPYGQPTATNPVFVTKSTGGTPKLALVIIGVAVLGGAVAAAAGIFAAVGGPGGLGGVDPKEPEDFAEMVDELEEETGSTIVNWVGLYNGYAIVDVPYDASDPEDDREVSYRWDGGGLEEWTKGTATDERFDLADIEPEVIDGMCDPVLEELEDSSRDDCYVFISKPDPSYEKDKWFNALASNDFGQSVNVYYDLEGVEVERTVP